MLPAYNENSRSEAGFTLLEVLAVFVILALMASAVHISAGRQAKGAALKSTAVQFAAHLRAARSHAIRTGRDQLVIVDFEQRTIRAGHASIRIPEFVNVEMKSAVSERRSSSIAGIRFFANGRSSGGRISMAYGELRYDVQINWLTGRSSVVSRP